MASSRHVICTLYDHRYLGRGLCMIDSARANGFTGDIHVLCLNEDARVAMKVLALPGVHTLMLADLERHIPELLVAKANRGLLEYYFTCMAALHTYLMDTLPEADCTMYVDADIWFFENPELVFDAIGDAPAAITPHNFTPTIAPKLSRFGAYNAGWSAFRRTPEGKKLLAWWLARSLEWCYTSIDGYRYANQGYLTRFQEIAPGTRALSSKGFNVGPWNVGGYAIAERDGKIILNGDQLVFFHFHGLKLHYGVFYFDAHRTYRAPMPRLIRNRVYRPYVQALVANEKRASAALAVSQIPMAAYTILPHSETRHGFTRAGIAAWVRQAKSLTVEKVRRLQDILAGRPILVWKRHIW